MFFNKNVVFYLHYVQNKKSCVLRNFMENQGIF